MAKRKGRGCLLKGVLVTLIIVEVLLLVFFFKADDWLLNRDDQAEDETVNLGSRVNVLVLGRDDGEEEVGRSDSMLLMSADLKNDRVKDRKSVV